MRLPSASATDAALACLGSCVLPGVEESGEHAEAGNVMHRYLDTAHRVGKEAALEEAPEDEREWLEALDLDALPVGAESEVALGWNHETDAGVRYRLAEHRGYPADGLYHGTADLVGVADGVVFVADYKRFGAKVAARQSAQLGLLALAAARLTGCDEAEAMMLAPGGKGWHVDRVRFDALDLAGWADRFVGLAARIESHPEGRTPALVVGGHCTYCRALRWCPAQNAIVRQVSAIDLSTVDDLVANLTPEEAGEFWERVRLVEKIAEGAKKALQRRAEQAPIPLPGGKVLMAVPWAAQHKSDVAKAELEALGDALKARGEIVKVRTTQVRAVTAPKALT